MFDPANWYWRHDDGRFFSSALGNTVGETNQALIEWIDEGHQPTRWPVDEAGEQTDQALEAVLAPYGLFWRLDQLKLSLKKSIDDAAERERERYLTPGAGQAMTYSRKVEEARTLQADGDPDPVDYPMLAVSIGIDGDDIETVAATVLAMDAAWAQIGAAIEGARLVAKRAVDNADDASAAKAVVPLWPGGPN